MPSAALVLIDLQQAIDDPSWAVEGPRNNRNAELAARRLLASWRASSWPIFHVRHHSVEPQSTYRPGQPGNQFKPGLEPLPGEFVIPKHTGSAFTGTLLESLLKGQGITDLVIAGVITNNSVESTVRHGATLGFAIALAEDACFTFARRDWSGTLRTAAEVHAMSLANLDQEYCRVTASAAILALAGSPQRILPYYREPLELRPWDDRAAAAAAYLRQLIAREVEHVGSTAVPGCAGKGVIDLLIPFTEGELPALNDRLFALGFQPQSGIEPFPEARPLRIGAIFHGGRLWRVHAHVVDAASPEVGELRYFRYLLCSDETARQAYVLLKQQIIASGVRDSLVYTKQKATFIQDHLASWRAHSSTPASTPAA